MDDDTPVTLESDYPAVTLRRVVDDCLPDFPAAAVTLEKPGHRGLDPTIAVAIVSGISSVAVPFMTALAQRIFSKEPETRYILVDSSGVEIAALESSQSAEVHAEVAERAIAAGARRVRILKPSD